MIEDYASLIRYMRALKKSDRRIYVAFDEWNVWYRMHDRDHAWWQQAPHLLEEIYNLEDALVVAQYLNSFIRHADIVKIACLAQIVNVIAPILTQEKGLLIQSIYHPFVTYSQNTQGVALAPIVDCSTYRTEDLGDVPFLDVAACYAPEQSELCVFAVNRSTDRNISVDVKLSGASLGEVARAQTLTGDDPAAANSWEEPERVRPVEGEARVKNSSSACFEVPSLGLTAAVFSVS
jgi:alpha-N-arabinofuranosidase